MCLTTVDEVTEKYEEGYKVLEYDDNGRLNGPYYHIPPPNEDGWYICQTTGMMGNRNARYKTGFHFFTCLDQAVKYRSYEGLFKIVVCEMVASGTQYGMKVGVCRKFKIVEEVLNQWQP